MPRNNKPKSVVVRKNTQIKRHLSGRHLRLPQDPPLVTQNPWWPLTIAFTTAFDSNSASIIDVSTLGAFIRDRIGIANTSLLELRILRAGIWQIGTGDWVACSFYSQVNSSSLLDPLFSGYDVALSSHNWAKIGYEWPDSEAAYPSGGAYTTRVAKALAASSASNALWHFSVLWRPIASQTSFEVIVDHLRRRAAPRHDEMASPSLTEFGEYIDTDGGSQ